MSFSDPELRSHGTAWVDYHRVLIRFDLSGIDPSKFAGVRKAVVRLTATEVGNESNVESVLAASTVEWNVSGSFATPDGKGQWPAMRGGDSNLDYAMDAEGRARLVIKQPGTIEFDVTDVLERWLYQGIANRGFILATGPTIFGRPGAGTWTLAFASSESGEQGPQLAVEMVGVPPVPGRAHATALALYPSPLLAPVRNPYLFVWYGVSDEKVWERLPTANMSTYNGRPDWLAQRGVLFLTWGEGGPSEWFSTEAAWADYYVGIAKGPALGYCMHEWHLPDHATPWAVHAVRVAERQHPATYSAFFYQGQEEMARLAAEGGLDLLILEGYTHVIKEFPIEGFAAGMDAIKSRIDIARKAGAIEKHVVMLGHVARFEDYHPGHELTAAVIEEQMRELRAYAPEMPGIGFYYSGGEELAAQCDALARKYFVEPAPSVAIAEPGFQARLATPHVTIRAEATAKADRTVARYRWFIDNRLVAETSDPSYVWDLRGERPGQHFVTVHAVDSAFNRAASQILVDVAE